MTTWKEGDVPPVGIRVATRDKFGTVKGWAREPGAMRENIHAKACPSCRCFEPDPFAGWWLVELEGCAVAGKGEPLLSVEWPPHVEPAPKAAVTP